MVFTGLSMMSMIIGGFWGLGLGWRQGLETGLETCLSLQGVPEGPGAGCQHVNQKSIKMSIKKLVFYCRRMQKSTMSINPGGSLGEGGRQGEVGCQ